MGRVWPRQGGQGLAVQQGVRLHVDTFALKSATDGATVTFSPIDAREFTVLVEVRGSNVHASGVVYAFMPHRFITDYFDDLAKSWRGWTGEKCWSSLENELTFRATADSVGHITLAFELRLGPYATDWTVSGTVALEAGQLERIASEAENFFEGLGLLRAI